MMSAKVVYQSTTGNTKKVADAIARTAGCVAEPVATATMTEPVDMLFLGAAVHGGAVDPSMKAFIAGLDPALIKRAALFSTGFEESKGKAAGIMKDLLTQRGISVTDTCYFCKGRFVLLNRSHPDATDLKAAEEFARSVLAT
jgi:flavodoxin